MSRSRNGVAVRPARYGFFFLALLICICAWALPASAQPELTQSGIATAHPLATRAGEEILAAGGNAFDAAVAISAALAVVEPYASGLGGGGFWLLHEAETGRQVLIDGREVAPAAATRDMYLDAQGKPQAGLSVSGPLAAGIPGEPAALAHLAKNYGRLPLATSLAPAIRYAEQGIEVSRGIGMGLMFRAEAARNSPAFSAIYMPGGKPVEAGATLRFRDLARTLRKLAADGHDGFYRGSVARRMVTGVQAAGGIWTRDDLAAYKVVEREPIRVQYRDATLVMAPPPSSGGVVIGDSLNILRAWDLGKLQSVERKHLTVEAMRRAYRDRAMYLGDPAFVSMPIERLLNPWYADGQRTSIRLDRATPSDDLPGIAPAAGGGTNTTHFSVLDKAGNRVAGTLSINTWFGAVFIPPGTGVILNNEMDDFSAKAGTPNSFELLGADANAIAPGKRMLSSMSPSFIESPRGVAILGTPGGSRIISMVLLSALAWMDGADAREMVSLKRYHHQYYPDVVVHEEGAFTVEEKTGLEARGHKLELSPRSFGNMQVVTWDRKTGRVDAASDPRGGGEVTVY
ncbi:MAG: gamma-glutamyltranspeptidase / glutathione hydrolase [Pseudomonadota bacterium]|nr:gamma-glutamyltranspeptidase / glutathione hydrolase [Pseudomonadota bacterium]